MKDIISFAGAFIAIQIFKIIMFKKDKDYSGYDERQELIRGRAFRYGFLTLAFLLATVVLWEECVGTLPIEFSLLMMACLMVIVMAMQYMGLRGQIKNGDVIVHGVLTWDGGIYLLILVFFALILANLLVKSWMDKRGGSSE